MFGNSITCDIYSRYVVFFHLKDVFKMIRWMQKMDYPGGSYFLSCSLFCFFLHSSDVFYTRLYTSTVHSFPQLIFCTAVNHFFVDIFDMVMMGICAPLHNRKSNKSTVCSSSRQHIQCSAYIHYKGCGCLLQVDVCATTSVYWPQKCEEIISEVSDLRWIATRAEINKAKVNIIAIITVESDTRWFPHHWRACVIISNTLY